MVGQRMGSQAHDNASNSTTITQVQNPDPKPNPLGRQGSIYTLTLNEVQNQLGELGKPLSSMNLDELLKSVYLAEGNTDTQGFDGIEFGSTQQQQQPASCSLLNQQSSVTLSRDLSKRTVDEVWQDIQKEQKGSSLERDGTLGEMSLEDFLVKAGVVAGRKQLNKNVNEITGQVEPIATISHQPHQPQWNLNYSQQPNTVPVYVPVQPIVDVSYVENQMTMSSSPVMCGTLSDTQTPRRKRIAPEDIFEKSVERRQKRMIKNRESAARSRARKQAYTHELENKISRLEEENERLRRQQEWEKVLPTIPPPEPKCQLRRTNSATF